MIARNIAEIKNRIAELAELANRDVATIRLVAVSKRFPVEAIVEAQAGGQLLFGENYIQEAQQKEEVLGDRVLFHFIGHLQSNKAKIAARIFSMIETVDRPKLAIALNKHLVQFNKKLDVLVQVNIGRDENKAGIAPENAEKLLETIAGLPMLRAKGLMTMPPLTHDAEEARPYFKRLRELAHSLAEKKMFHNNKTVELSMGMTNDYHVAIEEGATLVRIGTAIFGERPPKA